MRVKTVARKNHKTITPANDRRLKLVEQSRKTHPSEVGVKIPGNEKRRWRPGTVALREIRHYQKGAQTLIPLAPFARLCKEIILDHRTDFRCAVLAIQALQQASEAHVVRLFENTQLCAIHCGRVGIQLSDMKLARRIAGKC